MLTGLLLSLMITLLSGIVGKENTAQADPPASRVFIIFDTSGSMLWNYPDDRQCFGDGSVDYPHRNGCNNDVGSKLFHAKRALAQVIDASPQVEFALLRYGQLEPATQVWPTKDLGWFTVSGHERKRITTIMTVQQMAFYDYLTTRHLTAMSKY